MINKNRMGEISLIIVLIVFAGLFFWAKQYWITFLALVITLVGWRVEDVLYFSVTKEGIKVKLSALRKEFETTLRSDKSIDEKVKASQELIDEAFRAGYQIAGGKKVVGTINNVKIWGSKDGNKNIQYDET
ncbi:MAG: hypothetical protein WCT37_03310 [Patescibacteria group bacterium]|jgi:hypothetical protein